MLLERKCAFGEISNLLENSESIDREGMTSCRVQSLSAMPQPHRGVSSRRLVNKTDKSSCPQPDDARSEVNAMKYAQPIMWDV